MYGTVAACLWYACSQVESRASGGIGIAETFQLSRLTLAMVSRSDNYIQDDVGTVIKHL